MTTADELETGYRRLLRWYPSSYRARHEEEIVGVLMDAAGPGQRRPGARESLDLVWSALKIRLRTKLRGTGSQPWPAALALAGVVLPVLMLLLKLTVFLDRGAQYGFGTPADILVGAYGEPGSYARIFQLNPHSVALTFNLTQMLTAGPLPALTLAVLACLGWRRIAATVAGLVLLAYLGITLTNGYSLVAAPRVDVTLYAYALEASILFIAPGAARGWRALPWRPAAVLAAATVAAGIAMNGGLQPLLGKSPVPVTFTAGNAAGLVSVPHGFLVRLFGFGEGLAQWLLYQGTLVAVIAAALLIMLLSSPVSLRSLALLAVPFALGVVMYVCSLISPPLPAPIGNTLVSVAVLLIALAAMALGPGRGRRAKTGVPGHLAPPADT